ncbi:MAG: hypothetical protein H7061_00670 [Bdellovibrionaceae bacterium]|nr:hypothetical protein [Bdellovibrio sp.]
MLGVDLIDVSLGNGGWRRPEGHQGEDYLLPDATLLKSYVNLPIIGVSGIETDAFIDDLIANNKVAFVALVRAILSDPCG